MKISTKCPNEDESIESIKHEVVKAGTRTGKTKKQIIQRYKCKTCNQFFSSKTILGIEGQKKPEINETIFRLYAKGMTLRGIAEVLKVQRKTVYKKFVEIATKCMAYHEMKIEEGYLSNQKGKPVIVYDEMETYEKTKLKPLSIGISFDYYNKKIIHMKVGEMKARGRGVIKLWDAVAGLKKYKPRVDERTDLTIESLLMIDNYTRNSEKVVLLTDNKPAYYGVVNLLNPEKFQHVPVQRGYDVKLNGKKQRSRKKIRTSIIKWSFKPVVIPFEHVKAPYFRLTKTQRYERLLDGSMKALNKLCAVVRNDTSRLRRTSFINTQKAENLQLNLYLYMAYYNGYDFHQIMTYRPLKIAA